jgi:nucleoside-diphosphate-sugar epimerase
MRRVLVIGASGWIGMHCLAPLLDLNFDVHGIRFDGPEIPIPGVTWHRVNILDRNARLTIAETVRPTHLLHLAWNVQPGYRTSHENWVWLAASVELLDLFVRMGGSRFVGAGTCLEYDWTNRALLDEFAPAVVPTTPYGCAKQALSMAVSAAGRATALSTAWGRVFFPFGPGESSNRLVPSVVTSLIRGIEARCTDGHQIRDFIYIKDVGKAFARLVDSEVSGPVNIGSDRPMTIRDLISRFARSLDATSLVRFGAYSASGDDAAPFVAANLGRLVDEVGYRPETPLDTSIGETIEFWRRRVGVLS